jgi:hypothetical protein
MIQRIRTLQDLLVKSGMTAAVVWYSRDLLYYRGSLYLRDTYPATGGALNHFS